MKPSAAVGMIRYMPPASLRVVVHAIIKIEITPSLIQNLKDQLARVFANKGLIFADFCIDLGVPKQHPEEYPALELLGRGEADALIVSRTPMFGKTDRRDLIQRLCLPEDMSIALLGAEPLRELGLLPARKAVTEAAKRAAELRAAGMTRKAIGHRLESEGFRTQRGGRWSGTAVTKLLQLTTAPEPSKKLRNAEEAEPVGL